MNATQGVILVMGSALVLWLMWSAQSPFAAKGGAMTPLATLPGGGTIVGGQANPPPGQPLPQPYNISPAPGVLPPNSWFPTPGSAGAGASR
jgi:hypothetical protein